MDTELKGTDLINEIKFQFETMVEDMEKAYAKEQIAAARRARTASVALSKMLKSFRAQSLSDIG